MSRMAHRRLQKAGFTIPLVRGRAESLPFAPAVFDSILATFPAPFIVLPETLNALHRVLKPDGRLVIVPEAALTGGGIFRPIIEFLFTITGQRQAPAPGKIHSPSPSGTAPNNASKRPGSASRSNKLNRKRALSPFSLPIKLLLVQ
jgi:SAM-dependent methyltransferase